MLRRMTHVERRYRFELFQQSMTDLSDVLAELADEAGAPIPPDDDPANDLAALDDELLVATDALEKAIARYKFHRERIKAEIAAEAALPVFDPNAEHRLGSFELLGRR